MTTASTRLRRAFTRTARGACALLRVILNCRIPQLGAVPSNLARFREAELIHGRWAMLGAAGALFAEALGYGDWLSVQQKFADGEPLTYFGSKVQLAGGSGAAAAPALRAAAGSGGPRAALPADYCARALA